jgi:hypothetical protein
MIWHIHWRYLYIYFSITLLSNSFHLSTNWSFLHSTKNYLNFVTYHVMLLIFSTREKIVLFGQSFYWQISYGQVLFWANVSGQMSLGKCFITDRHTGSLLITEVKQPRAQFVLVLGWVTMHPNDKYAVKRCTRSLWIRTKSEKTHIEQSFHLSAWNIAEPLLRKTSRCF